MNRDVSFTNYFFPLKNTIYKHVIFFNTIKKNMFKQIKLEIYSLLYFCFLLIQKLKKLCINFC